MQIEKKIFGQDENGIVYKYVVENNGFKVELCECGASILSVVMKDGFGNERDVVLGLEGLEAYKEYRPDLITLDITMPEMDGVEALEKIMEFDSAAKVVMITAAGQQQKVIKALRVGASKFIMKPFNREEVIAALQEIIKR